MIERLGCGANFLFEQRFENTVQYTASTTFASSQVLKRWLHAVRDCHLSATPNISVFCCLNSVRQTFCNNPTVVSHTSRFNHWCHRYTMKEESNVFGSLAAIINRTSRKKRICKHRKRRLVYSLEDPRGMFITGKSAHKLPNCSMVALTATKRDSTLCSPQHMFPNHIYHRGRCLDSVPPKLTSRRRQSSFLSMN
jgi:hypothetical protein